jgi:RNA polymerase sigma-70 factor (ECF subfamily)
MGFGIHYKCIAWEGADTLLKAGSGEDKRLSLSTTTLSPNSTVNRRHYRELLWASAMARSEQNDEFPPMLYSFDHQQVEHRPALQPGESTDEQLMESIQRGEEQALDTLHRRHQTLLRKIISRIIPNDYDVDELVQECLLEVWRRAGNYDPSKGHALGWLVTLARRRTIDRVRRKSAYYRAQDRYRVECETESSAGVHCGADEQAAQDDAAAAITRLISALPAAQQQAIRLAYFHGMSQRQIAAHTGIPLGTIKTRLELALRKLKSSALAFGELRDSFNLAA